jgi:two-component sensor histidine kinase
LIGGLPSLFYFKIDIFSYLVFHNIAEFFSIMVSLSIFGLGWYSFDKGRNCHSLFLGTSFLTVGLLDFMHALGYSGMPDFISPNTTMKASQFWIAARMIESSMLLFSGFLYSRKQVRWIKKAPLLALAIAVTFVIFAGITFFPDKVPATFIEGTGLTPFKKNSEYVIIVMLVLATAVYGQQMIKTRDKVITYYLSAFIICIFSEFSFTFYKSAFDTYNMVGHIYKIFAFYLIYKGIFVAAIHNPYEQLVSTNERLTVEITERKRAEDAVRQSLKEKDILLRELYHRTKNTMQVIMGMIRLQSAKYAGNSELQQLVKATEDRIQAISLVHQMLYTTKDLSHIDIREYLNTLTALIYRGFSSSSSRISLTMDIDEQCYLLDTAIPFGLIINELMTNSLKHAFPDDRKGTISISLKRGDDGLNIFIYKDDGVGVAEGFDFRNQESLGLKLIHSIAEQQMRGQLVFKSGTGIRCEVVFKSDIYEKRV